MNTSFLIDLLDIIFINLVLSADNALIYGMTIRGLAASQRKKVLIWTTICILGSYIVFASLVTLLMDLSYIKLIGGILLLWVAIKMLTDFHHEPSSVESTSSVWEAVRIIVVSNLIISFDNVLAISVIAKGDYTLIILGAFIGIALLLFGSSLVVKLMNQVYILRYVGAGVLAYTAISMGFDDPFLQPYDLQEPLFNLLLTFVVLIVGLIWVYIKLTLLKRRMEEFE